MDDLRLRSAMFAHLDRLLEANPTGSLRSADINTFSFDGHPLRLTVQTGIWKPAGLRAALTIRTTYTAPGDRRPYEDQVGPDGFIRYKYRGTDPEQSENRALRAAMMDSLPLAYFLGIASGVYVCHYPVWLVDEDRSRHEFSVRLYEGQQATDLRGLDALQRDYVVRLARARLHQPVFRATVLRAYGERCAMCRLRHARLLDAAHILPDGHPRGDPVVPNGMALCKIHHAAYDADILGVRPDLVIEVQAKVLREIDGPMLRHGLQDMNGLRLVVPSDRRSQPDPVRLEERFGQFRMAG